MMSTVGVEHAKFVNPDLTWKTVTKGNRSVTRRTRKQLTGSTIGAMDATNTFEKEFESTTVSESEKVGVAVLGRRFTDKVDQLPIKKRRFVFRSPSPPPLHTLSEHIEIPENFVVPIQQASGQLCWNSNVRRKPSRTEMFATEELDDGIEDFSGIEMLATMACDSGVIDDIDHALGNQLAEESIQSACSFPMEESNTSLETASVSPKDIVCEVHVENLALHSIALLHKPLAGQDERKVEKSASPRDDRSHWDLNLSMDAWEQPSAIGHDDCLMIARDLSINRSKPLQVLQDCGVQEARDDNHDSLENVASSDVPRDISILLELKDLPDQPNGFDTEEHKFEGCADVSVNHDECVLTPVGNSEEPSISPIADADVDADGSTRVVSMDPYIDSSPRPNVGSNEIFEENETPSSANADEGTEDGKLLCVENIQVDESDVASPYVPELEKVTSEIDRPTLNVDDCLNVEKGCDEEMVNTNTSDGIEAVSEIEDLGPSPKCEDALTCVDEHGLVNAGSNGQADGSLSVPHVEIDSAGHDVSEKLMQESSGNSQATQGVAGCMSKEISKIDHNDHTSGLGKMATEDRSADSSGSVVSRTDKNWVVGLQNSMELQAGYDSQFEDGELRESYPFWEENEGDEIEHVDYEYDSDDDRLCHLGEGNEKKVELEKAFVLGSLDCMAGSDVSSKMIGLTTSKIDLLPCTEGKLSSDGMQRGRDVGSDKFMGRDRSFSHLRGRRPGGPHSVSSATNRDSVYCHSRSYNCSYSSGRSRPKSVIESCDGELKETSPCWEENDFEGEEIEQVNYESDEEKLFHTAEISETKMETQKNRLSSESEDMVKKTVCVIGDALRGSSATPWTGSTEMADGGKIKKNAVVYTDGSDVKYFSARLVEVKASKREMLPKIDESLSSDIIQGSRSDVGDSCRQDEREVDTDKFMGRDRSALHVRSRSPGGGHFVSPMGYWDSKRRQSSVYNSSYNAGRPRPKSVIESHAGSDDTVSESARVSGPDNFRRQFLTSSSNGVYRGVGKRRSAANTDDTNYMHTGILHDRDTSPGRSRVRRYPQEVSRGFRNRTMPEDSSEYSGRMPYRIARRERSISPFSGGGRLNYGQPYKKPRSSSRTHSPNDWWRSKSPNLKSDPRMERVRLPFQKRFAADCEEDLMSPPRNRFSPQRYSRWFEDRNLDNFRGRKSPTRGFRQGQRFESARSVRRPNSDDCLRPLMRPRRFPDMGGASRACKYEGSDDDKHGNRYEMIHPVRRFDTDGVVRRFRYNGDNSIVGMTPDFVLQRGCYWEP